jgi:uncharacterized protein (TIGR02231 family)
VRAERINATKSSEGREIHLTVLDTSLTKATVFRDGARVSRKGTAKLDSGPQRIVITGITNQAQSDSFRVKGKGPAVVVGIDVGWKQAVFEPSSDVRPLHDELRNLEDRKGAIEDDIELHSSKLAGLDGMMGQFAEHFGMIFAAGEGEIGSLSDIDNKSGKMYGETKKELRKLQEDLKKVNTEDQVTRDKIGRAEAGRRTETFYEAEISLDVKQSGTIELELTYQVDNASWSPSYDVDFGQEKATLRRIAMVRNSTRELWGDVSLTISTATARPVQAVKASPLYIYDAEDYVPRDKGKMKRMAKMDRRPPPSPAPGGAPAAMLAPPEPEPIMEETFAEATEMASGISVYELPKPVTIPDDSDEHPVTLIEEDLDTKTIHYWYTDGMSEVVAQDEVTNGSTVILPGDVRVFAEGDFIGQSRIGMVSPREEFRLGARTAYDVKAAKELVEREVEKAGVIRGKLRRAYKYRLKIESFSKKSINLEVKDRIPHSLSPSIQISFDWEELRIKEPALGILEWELDINPGEKREIEYEYEVVWDREKQLNRPLP